ncbi:MULTISPECIES: iron ABC transporter permease [unclassified Halomonas]|uniref:FecCD family ABC transporter permease n=2 Tax=Halomonas TaxID=2745 RepID=UPI0005FA5D6A|nr:MULTISPECIES: iron ABC transporter permease [unclassified Halomonas]KJZ18175.1 iron ABC transporter permease [Halomonas sp. S2151]MCJ8286293.1 iron ABC transporter permease [Halomonas sp.]NQY72665.1 iron ABC transporter permease [Halomonas sp.]
MKARPLAPGRTGHSRPTGVYLLLAALAASIMMSVVIGARPTDLTALMGLLDGRIDSIDEAAIASRLPRTLLALLAGAALAVAGATMQGLTRNPLADPGLLGVNAGAALAVVIGIAWFDMQQASGYIWVAIAGAGASALLVYLVANLGRGGATPLRLALSGAVVTAALTSLTSAVILPRADIAGLIHSWLIGGVGGATLDRITPVLPFLVLGLAASLLAARKLNLMALGDEAATGLGERVALARALAAVGAILLCGATTAACGPIGFVGLVVPHALRLLVGADYRRLLPLCALGGALLVILADTLGRVLVRPAELDVGIVTALLGGPVFIWIVRRHTLRSL